MVTMTGGYGVTEVVSYRGGLSEDIAGALITTITTGCLLIMNIWKKGYWKSQFINLFHDSC